MKAENTQDLIDLHGSVKGYLLRQSLQYTVSPNTQFHYKVKIILIQMNESVFHCSTLLQQHQQYQQLRSIRLDKVCKHRGIMLRADW